MVGKTQLIRDLETLHAMLANGAWPRMGINELIDECAQGRRRTIREPLLRKTLAEQAAGKPPQSGRARGVLRNWEAGNTPKAIQKLVATTLAQVNAIE